MSIVKRLVELMGGRITVQSQVGKGTVFKFFLSFKAVESSSDIKNFCDLTDDPGVPVERLNILLVEDNPVNQLLAKKMLEKKGLSVTAVDNGQKALDYLSNNTFDLVFMDVQMPVMDGLEAVKRVRSDNSGLFDPNIPIVAMTAHAMKGDRESFIKVGMDDYISKPIDKEELVLVIDRVMKKG